MLAVDAASLRANNVQEAVPRLRRGGLKTGSQPLPLSALIDAQPFN